jgi:hypothetical protein
MVMADPSDLGHGKKIPHTGDIESLDRWMDSSTNATVGWTKNTQNPKKIKNGKNNPKRKNSKTSRDMPKLAIHPLTSGL